MTRNGTPTPAVERLFDVARAKAHLPSPPQRRTIREAAKLSRIDLATALGVNPATIRHWELGSRTPRGELLVAYCAVLAELRHIVGEAAGDAAA